MPVGCRARSPRQGARTAPRSDRGSAQGRLRRHEEVPSPVGRRKGETTKGPTMRSKTFRRALAISRALAAMGGAGAAMAAVSGHAGAITAVAVAGDPGLQETSSRSYVDIPGAATTITVPRGQRALVIARFSGASQCGSLNPDDDGCFVRILVDGVEAEPA